MFHWIKDEITIDFPVSRALEMVMQEAEQYDRDNQYWQYIESVEMIEIIMRKGFEKGKYTEEQRTRVLSRYSLL